MPLGQNIEHLMTINGTKYPELASTCGTDPQAIQQLVKRNSRVSQFAPDLAAYYGIPTDLLLSGNPETIDSYLLSKKKRIVEYPKSVSTAHHVAENIGYLVGLPVTGVVVTGLREFQQMNEVDPDESKVRWPTSDQSAYALRIFGDHLAPRCKHGEYAIIEPGHPVEPGDEVVVGLIDDRQSVLVCQFLYERNGMSYFESINGDSKKVNIETVQIEYMKYIAGFAKPSLSFR